MTRLIAFGLLIVFAPACIERIETTPTGVACIANEGRHCWTLRLDGRNALYRLDVDGEEAIDGAIEGNTRSLHSWIAPTAHGTITLRSPGPAILVTLYRDGQVTQSITLNRVDVPETLDGG